jgi:hypothetical protein
LHTKKPLHELPLRSHIHCHLKSFEFRPIALLSSHLTISEASQTFYLMLLLYQQ